MINIFSKIKKEVKKFGAISMAALMAASIIATESSFPNQIATAAEINNIKTQSLERYSEQLSFNTTVNANYTEPVHVRDLLSSMTLGSTLRLYVAVYNGNASLDVFLRHRNTNERLQLSELSGQAVKSLTVPQNPGDCSLYVQRKQGSSAVYIGGFIQEL